MVESDAIMQQDATGPVLPVLSVEGVDEAVAFISRREKPLCVYVYSSDDKVSSTGILPHCSEPQCISLLISMTTRSLPG